MFVDSFYAILKRKANTYYHKHESITWRFLIKCIIGFVELTITGPILFNRTKIGKFAWCPISERCNIITIGIDYIPFWVGENRTSFISAIVWKLRCKFLRYCIVGSIFFWELKRVAFITFEVKSWYKNWQEYSEYYYDIYQSFYIFFEKYFHEKKG